MAKRQKNPNSKTFLHRCTTGENRCRQCARLPDSDKKARDAWVLANTAEAERLRKAVARTEMKALKARLARNRLILEMRAEGASYSLMASMFSRTGGAMQTVCEAHEMKTRSHLLIDGVVPDGITVPFAAV